MSATTQAARPITETAVLHLSVGLSAHGTHTSVEVVERPTAAHAPAPADADWSVPSLIAAVAAVAAWRMVRGRR